MDGANLAFADQSFDAAVAMFVMTVVPDPDLALNETGRVVQARRARRPRQPFLGREGAARLGREGGSPATPRGSAGGRN